MFHISSGLLKTIPVGTRLSRLKMKRLSKSPSIWYSKFSSLPGQLSCSELLICPSLSLSLRWPNSPTQLKSVWQDLNTTRAVVDGTPSQIPAFLPVTFTLGSRSHRFCPLPSTSCHLCTCKGWSYYFQLLRRRCIYKKIYDLNLGVKVT